MIKTLCTLLAALLVSASALAQTPVKCDMNNDGAVDRNDVAAVRALIGTPASANPQADANNDGLITINDVRACTLRCTLPQCAVNAAKIAAVSPFSVVAVCDMNGGGQINSLDITIIRPLIGTPAVNNPAADANGDGKITINDVRACILRCTNANCAI